MRTRGRLLLSQRRQSSPQRKPATLKLYILLDQVARLHTQIAMAEAEQERSLKRDNNTAAADG